MVTSTVELRRTVSYTLRLTTKGDTRAVIPMSLAVFMEVPSENIDFNKLHARFSAALEPFMDVTFISINDANLPYMLSPKNGMSIQEAISWIKEANPLFSEYGWVHLGKEVPAITANNLMLVVTRVEPTQETVAGLMYTQLAENFPLSKLVVTNEASGVSIVLRNNASEQLSLDV